MPRIPESPPPKVKGTPQKPDLRRGASENPEVSKAEAQEKPKPDGYRHSHPDPLTGRMIPHEQFHRMYESRRPDILFQRIFVRIARVIENIPDRFRPAEQDAPREQTVFKGKDLQLPFMTESRGKAQAEMGKWGKVTPFEKLIYERYREGEGGKKGSSGEGSLQKGLFKFRARGEKEAGELEAKFLPFREARKVAAGDLDSVIFRMILRNPPSLRQGERPQNMPALIGDLRLVQGKTEKFARISLETLTSSRLMAEVVAQLSRFIPGTLLTKVLLSRWFGGGELNYHALSHKIVRPDLTSAFKSALTESAEARGREGGIQYGREAQKGTILSARTEQFLAERFDLNVRPIQPESIFADPRGMQQEGLRERRRRSWGEGGEDPLYIPGWVPWYQLVWQPRKWKGKIRWYVPLLYFVAVSSIGLGAVALVRFLLQR